MPTTDMSYATEMLLKLDRYVYAGLSDFRDRLPGADKSNSVFLIAVAAEFSIYLLDMFSFAGYNPRPLYVFPIIFCAVFSQRSHTYAAACLACVLSGFGFARDVAMNGDAFPLLSNTTFLFLGYIALAEFGSLSVGTIKELVEYVTSLEAEVAILRVAAEECGDDP